MNQDGMSECIDCHYWTSLDSNAFSSGDCNFIRENYSVFPIWVMSVNLGYPAGYIGRPSPHQTGCKTFKPK